MEYTDGIINSGTLFSKACDMSEQFPVDVMENSFGYTETFNPNGFIPIEEVVDPDSLDDPYNPYSQVTDVELSDYVKNSIEKDDEALIEYNKRNLGVKSNNKSFDILSRFIRALDLHGLQYCDSNHVYKVIKAIETASSFRKPWMREISIKVLKEAIRIIKYIHSHNFSLNGKMPDFFQTIKISPFINHFDNMNGTITDISLNDLKILFFNVYVPFRRLSGKRYQKKNINTLYTRYVEK